MADPQYYGTVPVIQNAFQNDPRTKLAASMLAQGTSTAPVATGQWGVASGLARAAQAIAGAVIEKGQNKKYASREEAYMNGMKDAANTAAGVSSTVTTDPSSTPASVNPATANPGLASAASALSGPAPAPMPQGGPAMPLGLPQGGAPAAPSAPAATPLPPPAPAAPMGAPTGPMGGSPLPVIGAAASVPMAGGFAGSGAPPGMGSMSGDMLYRYGINPTEGGTDPKTGAFLTSPKGAVGPGQIMPGTGPEAAKLAGLPWDEARYRGDAQYNNALGSAYYKKQLATFGDPLKAAAAYNAGPGRVSRAIRQAATKGGDYTKYLPAETQAYIKSFAAKVGGGSSSDDDDGVVNTALKPAQLEQVPGLPDATPAQKPQAPGLPDEVQSSRLAIAQHLLATGNPDFAAIGQSYLDKGLDEQNAARTLHSQQQYSRDEAGYTADLNDWSSGRNTDREQGYQAHRDAVQRNFSREQTANNQQFQSGERVAGEQFQANQGASDQQFQAGQAGLNRATQLEIAGIRADGKGNRQQQRSAYFNTPTGLKMQQAAGDTLNANNVAIGKYKRFMDLNEKVDTGGMAYNTPVIGGAYGYFDPNVREMHALSADTTLAGLGGRLGAGISDGDRKFIEGSNISVGAPKQANDNYARGRIGALQRNNDYTTEFANAQADGASDPKAVPQFMRDWAAFAKAVPIVTYDKNGNATHVEDNPVTFQQWRASRPRFDAHGKRVN